MIAIAMVNLDGRQHHAHGVDGRPLLLYYIKANHPVDKH